MYNSGRGTIDFWQMSYGGFLIGTDAGETSVPNAQLSLHELEKNLDI